MYLAEPVTLEVSQYAAAIVEEDSPRELRLMVAQGELDLEGGDLGSILYYLSHDQDPAVSAAAINSLRELSGDRLLKVVEAPETHQRVLEILARLHAGDKDIAEKIACHPAASSETLEYLVGNGVLGAIDALAAASEVADLDIGQEGDAEGEPEPEESLETEDEEYHTKYQLAQTMGVAEKVKAALLGDKEWRAILIKDSNRMVSSSVLKNPRITDAEVLNIVKGTVQNDDIMLIICTNREWIKNYQVRKALVENNRTPLPFALRFLSSLGEKDVASFAKSKNISSVIATQAKRIIMNKKKS